MTEILNICPQLYQTPSEVVLQRRRAFYSFHKVKKEPVLEWLRRLKTCIGGCDFGILANFLLIDKFICELDIDELHELNYIGTLSLDRLLEALEDQTIYIENDLNEDEAFVKQSNDLNGILELKLDVGNDNIFDDRNIDSSDSEDNKQISETERELAAKEKQPERRKNTKKTYTEPSVLKPGQQIKGFIVDEENRFHCLDCGRKFARKCSYIQHSRLHTGLNLFSCTICNKVFCKPSHLKAHLRIHERERRAGRSFECHLCRFQFLAVHGLKIHMNLKHVSGVKNAYQCKHCNEVFMKQMELDNHLRSVHQLNVSHKCPHCSREFDELPHMKEHLTIHSEAKPFMCEICGNAFKTKKQLHMHMTKHTDERRFKCGECGQMLKSRSNYKNHMRQHTGERPFKCTHCEKTFVQRANYLKHLRWHSGDKPHGCTYCEKRFPTSYDKKLHENSMHTGNKPFKCEMCDRAFAQPSTLRVHRLRVHKQTKPDNVNGI
ncbi:zinc finger protein OZF-like [Sitodiplosis mosellana]|uniref:zinc finger protein OZF-like n=1 Tax=Sitodiplosis mosellana TaxID=263140 RepID=UPI0024450AAF|nr:zinc finger protein OZF-like [Sitodiplosis mosellana]